jgi:hypothetical protein
LSQLAVPDLRRAGAATYNEDCLLFRYSTITDTNKASVSFARRPDGSGAVLVTTPLSPWRGWGKGEGDIKAPGRGND